MCAAGKKDRCNADKKDDECIFIHNKKSILILIKQTDTMKFFAHENGKEKERKREKTNF